MGGQALGAAFGGRRPPGEAALGEPLVAEPESLAVVHEDFQRRGLAIAEDEYRSDERVLLQGFLAVVGRFKTSHSWALQNQPPLTGCFGGRFNKPQRLPGSLGLCLLLLRMAVQVSKARLPLVEILGDSIILQR